MLSNGIIADLSPEPPHLIGAYPMEILRAGLRTFFTILVFRFILGKLFGRRSRFVDERMDPPDNS